ncbi:MAG: ABC transporter permease [Bacteroidetes bacterium]|nr:ABC transporter permease [Bacteroidota bacterium]MBS1974487.1 ABC transporter permease [Bacteroidota bacterium]
MLHILKTEWLKIKGYPAFWWVMGITALTYPGINYLFHGVYENITQKDTQRGKILKMLIGNPFSFPEAWHTVAYFSSIFVFIPAIVVIMLITNEYTYKTNRQNIIDGWSRREFMIAKITDVIILTLLVAVLSAGVALVIGIANTEGAKSNHWQMSYYAGLFALQTFSQLSIAFTIGLLLRKSFIALAVFSFYGIIVEPIAVNVLKYKFDNNIGEYFPLEISQRLLPKPAFIGRIDEKAYQASLDAVKYHIGYTLALILLTWLICFWIYNRRDL